jgi:hypothetical protein
MYENVHGDEHKKRAERRNLWLKSPCFYGLGKRSVGVFPVFENKKDADAYANDYGDVVEIKRVTNDQ